MFKYCEKCKKVFDCPLTICPSCGSKLKKKYTEEELNKIQAENDEFTVINTLFFM